MVFAPISGAHLNPAVTLADVALGSRDKKGALPYIAAQVLGGITGTVLSNLMFELSAIEISETVRSGSGQWLGEVLATIGPLFVIFLMVREPASVYMIGIAVGIYIGGAYFFTSSTRFANPAVPIARMFSSTFAGIAPSSAPMFLAAQFVAVPLVVAMLRFWSPES